MPIIHKCNILGYSIGDGVEIPVSDTTTTTRRRGRGRPPKGILSQCPKCGGLGYVVVRRVISRTVSPTNGSEPGNYREYVYVRHGRHYCYIGRMHEDKDKK